MIDQSDLILTEGAPIREYDENKNLLSNFKTIALSASREPNKRVLMPPHILHFKDEERFLTRDSNALTLFNTFLEREYGLPSNFTDYDGDLISTDRYIHIHGRDIPAYKLKSFFTNTLITLSESGGNVFYASTGTSKGYILVTPHDDKDTILKRWEPHKPPRQSLRFRNEG